MTWKQMLDPEYVLGFIESFLMGFLPMIGLGSAVNGGGTVDVTAWPNGPTVVAASLTGFWYGIRGVRNIKAPSPTSTPPKIPFIAAIVIGPWLIAAPVLAQGQFILNPADITIGAAGTAATQICPRNSGRVSCTCVNTDGAVNMRVGNSAVSATAGARVTAGGTVKHPDPAPLFAISEGVAVAVSCTDVTR